MNFAYSMLQERFVSSEIARHYSQHDRHAMSYTNTHLTLFRRIRVRRRSIILHPAKGPVAQDPACTPFLVRLQTVDCTLSALGDPASDAVAVTGLPSAR